MSSLVLICLLSSPSQWWPIHAFGKAYLTFRSTLIYDDNIFRYSPKDLQEFKEGKNPDRYPFVTRDDLILRVTASLRYPGALSWGLGVTENSFLKNPEKDYLRLSGWLRFWRARLEIKYIPRFLLRYYPDIDTEENDYKPCRFNSTSLSASYTFGLRSLIRAKIWGGLFGYHFSPSFMEYDTKGREAGLTFLFKFRGFEPSLGGFYQRALARAWDTPGEKPETSDDPDISYRRWGVSAQVVKSMAKIPLQITFYYRFRYREFTPRERISGDIPPYDFYRERKERDHRFKLEALFSLNRRVSLFFSGRYEWRRVDSPFYERIFEIKNYERRILSIGMRSVL